MEFPKATPTIGGVSELGAEDLLGLEREPEPRPLMVIRDSHHAVARCLVAGYSVAETAALTGYSQNRIYALKKVPAFQQLLAEKHERKDDQVIVANAEYFEVINRNRIIAARLINDKLTAVEDPDDIDLRTLVAIHSDAADRTGYPKRTESINVNLGFAARLDQAIRRSGTVLKDVPTGKALEGELIPPLSRLRRI